MTGIAMVSPPLMIVMMRSLIDNPRHRCGLDGAITAQDCDDNDPFSTVIANDADCDGSTTANDCNDNNPLEAPGLTEVCDDGLDNRWWGCHLCQLH